MQNITAGCRPSFRVRAMAHPTTTHVSAEMEHQTSTPVSSLIDRSQTVDYRLGDDRDSRRACVPGRFDDPLPIPIDARRAAGRQLLEQLSCEPNRLLHPSARHALALEQRVDRAQEQW